MFTQISDRQSFRRWAVVCGLAGSLAGCGLLAGNDGEPASLQEAEALVERQAADDGKIACAVSGATEFSRVCAVEQSQSSEGLLLTVRHPDGGFRRLQVVKDGRGLIAADGADQAIVTPTGAKEVEVLLAGDRYRVPATVKQPPAAAAANAAVPGGVPAKS